MKKLLMVILFALMTSTVYATNYYASANGTAATIGAATGPASDSTKCMPGSLLSSSTGFAAGDTIFATTLGGSFTTIINPHSSSAGAPIVLAAVPGQSPLFNVSADTTYSIIISGHNNWDLVGLHVKGGKNANIDISGGSANIRLYNIVTEGGVEAVIFGSSSGCVINGLTNTGNLTGAYGIIASSGAGSGNWSNITLTSAACTTAAIWWESSTASNTFTLSNVVLRDITGGGAVIRPVTSGAVDIDNYTVRNVGSAGSYKNGLEINGQAAGISGFIFTVDNASIDTTGNFGIYLNNLHTGSSSYLKTITVNHTTQHALAFVKVDSLTVDGATITGGVDNIYLDTIVHPIMQNMVLTSPSQDNLWCNTVTNGTFNNCVCSLAGRDGISLTTSTGNVFNKCQASTAGQSDLVSNGDGFTSHDICNNQFNYCISANNRNSGFAMVTNSTGSIYNCTVVGNGDSTSVHMGVRGGFYDSGGHGWTIKNCIFDNNFPYNINVTDSVATASIMNYNLYYNTLRPSPFSVNGGSSGVTWSVYHSTHEANSKTGDPLFVNSSTGDYRLLERSPAINAGTPIAGLLTDIVNNIISGYPDMGAYEFINYDLGWNGRSWGLGGWGGVGW